MSRKIAVLLWMVCVLVAPILLIVQLVQALFGSVDRSTRMAIAFDQVGNAMFGGSEDETISSRAGRAMSEGRTWACIFCRLLDIFEKDHCKKSIGT
jgi:hypothetical protein